MTAYELLKRTISLPFFAIFFVADYIIYLWYKVRNEPYGSVSDIRRLYYDIWSHL